MEASNFQDDPRSSEPGESLKALLVFLTALHTGLRDLAFPVSWHGQPQTIMQGAQRRSGWASWCFLFSDCVLPFRLCPYRVYPDKTQEKESKIPIQPWTSTPR